jgi:hypothetical protein
VRRRGTISICTFVRGHAPAPSRVMSAEIAAAARAVGDADRDGSMLDRRSGKGATTTRAEPPCFIPIDFPAIAFASRMKPVGGQYRASLTSASG